MQTPTPWWLLQLYLYLCTGDAKNDLHIIQLAWLLNHKCAYYESVLEF